MKRCKDCKWLDKQFVYGCAHPLSSCRLGNRENYSRKWWKLWRPK